jgi:hypothetical protein
MNSAQDLHKGGVSPFGHPRINDRSHLPAAFRSVPRPSSPLGAKASTERPSLTHHHHTTQRPHAVPNRATNATSRNNSKPTLTHTTHTFNPDSPVKELLRRRSSLRQRGLLEATCSQVQKTCAGQPDAAAAQEQLMQTIERGERSQMIWRVV